MIRMTVRFIGITIAILLSMLVHRDSFTVKELHRHYLINSPFKETKKLSKKERLAAGLPPNTYNERVYELTMNPLLGYPTPEKLQELQRNLNQVRKKAARFDISAKAPGETIANSWNSIGPNNVGGRTRAALFDISDVEKDKVFAGGVSGGLWVHQDIDNSSPVSWSKVNGVPSNLAVTIIVQDKNEPTLLFAGTGESYTTGDAIGNGIYRSTDGGVNWSLIYGTGTSSVSTSDTSFGGVTEFDVDGRFYVNDMAFWDPTPGNTTNDDEIIFAALGAAYNSNFDGASTSTYMGTNSYGLYKSINKGQNWQKINTLISTSFGTGEDINDIEIAADNTLWISTTNNVYGSQSGRMYSSSDGTNFTLHNPNFPGVTQTDIGRVEIEPSGQDSATFYVLINDQSNNEAEIYKTTDGFVSLTKLNEPNDAHTDIPANDFTRGQAFYDLEIEVDPSNDNLVYVGGIDWHQSTNGGANWSQMTRWSTANTANYSLVHADQHGLYFRPGNSNQAIVVNDGGVSYVSDLSMSTTNDVFTDQETDFITTQFYSVAQTPNGFSPDFITGGTQDNGTHRLINPSGSPQNSTLIVGGDGGYTYIDQVSPTYYIANYIYNNYILRFETGSIDTFSTLNISNPGDPDYNEGDFINPGVLDSNLDILYVNASMGGTERIRRFKDLDTNAPTDDYMPIIAAMDDSPSTFEVSSFTTSSTVLLVGLDSGKLIKIADAEGASPVDTTLANNLGSISDVQFGANENEIYMTYYNYGVNNVYHTIDGGTTWSQKDGDLPDIPVWAIQHNPYDQNEVILASGLGIWQTDNFLDSNPNWTQSYNGMSDVAVHDLQFRGTSALNNRVLAGSYGRGIFTGSFTDAIAPTAVLTDTDSDNVVSNTDVVTITASFSEAMTATPTLSISGLITNTLLTQGSGTATWTYTWNVAAGSPANGVYTATVSGSDLAGNAYSGTDSISFTISNTLVDSTPPSVVLTDTDTDNLINPTDTVTIMATFSEAMAATPTLSISGLITNALMNIGSSNSSWSYVWNASTGSPTSGIYTATVSGSDLAGNVYSGSDSINFTYTNVIPDGTVPTIIGPTNGSHSDLNTVENYTPVGSFAADEPVSWTITGADQADFQINGLGYLSFSTVTDFENPADSDLNNLYEITVRATDASNNYNIHSVSVTVIDIDESSVDTTPPLITAPNGQIGSVAVWSSNENTNNQGTFQANETVSWSLSGTDGAQFSITASGTLTFNAGPDYENASDADGNNIYLFRVIATDNSNNFSAMDITLRITDINELAFNQIPGTERWVYGILNPAVQAFDNPTSSRYLGTDPISGAYSMRPSAAGSFTNQTIIVRNSNIDLGAMFDENVTKNPGQQLRFTGSVRNTTTGANEMVSGIVNGIIVYRIPPMGYLFHFKLDVIATNPFGSPASANTQWATGVLRFYIAY